MSAPVLYQPADFIAYVFTELCLRVLGVDPDEPVPFTNMLRRNWPLVTLEVYLVAAFVAVAVTSPSIGALVGIGVALAIVAPAAWFMWMKFLPERLLGRGPDGPIRLRAARYLHDLRNLDTVSRGLSGSAGPSVASVTGTMGMSSARIAATLPELVRRYKQFVRDLASARQVIVGVDEVDKMSDADARQFLNDVKTLFGERNCYYLVSVSEDAMSSFERRGMPFRDVFDSSFDTVLQIKPMDVAESVRLLELRVVGLGIGAELLCYALSGGMPRDLIRTARSVVEEAAGTDVELDSLLGTIAAKRMAAAEQAAATVARHSVLPDGTHPLLSWLDQLPDLWNDEGCVRGARWHVSDVLEHIAASEMDQRDQAELQRIVIQLATAAYHTDTVVKYLAAVVQSGSDVLDQVHAYLIDSQAHRHRMSGDSGPPTSVEAESAGGAKHLPDMPRDTSLAKLEGSNQIADPKREDPKVPPGDPMALASDAVLEDGEHPPADDCRQATALDSARHARAQALIADIETLARAHQQLMLAPKLAWDTLSKLRATGRPELSRKDKRGPDGIAPAEFPCRCQRPATAGDRPNGPDPRALDPDPVDPP